MEGENQTPTTEDKSFVFTITHGDISLLQLREGAIVNPSNTGLILSRGVSESIARRAGPDFQQKLHTARSRLYQNRLDMGRCIDTEPGALQAKRVIHASIIGKKPVDRNLITNAILNVYDLAEELELTEIAFPALGVGIGKFPIEEFVELFFTITMEELPRCEFLKHSILCLFDEEEHALATAYASEHADQVPDEVTVEITQSNMWTGLN